MQTLASVTIVSTLVRDSAFLRPLVRTVTVSSYDRPIILPSFSYMAPTTTVAASRQGRKAGESSLVFRKSLQRLIVSKSRKVSPTLKRVARQEASSSRAGGPQPPSFTWPTEMDPQCD